MFAFDVSLCENSTLGANEEMQHPSSPPPSTDVFAQQVMSQTAALSKNPQNAD